MKIVFLFLVVILSCLVGCQSSYPTFDSTVAWIPKTDSESVIDFAQSHQPVKVYPARMGADYVKMVAKVWVENRGDEVKEVMVSVRINHLDGVKKLADGYKVISALPKEVQLVEIELNTIYVPNLWSPELPLLLPLRVDLTLPQENVVNTYQTQIGLRWFSSHRTQGFSLNGVPTQIRGMAWAVSETHQTRSIDDDCKDMQAIKDAGANTVLFLSPPTQYQLALCDYLGLFAFVNFNAIHAYKIQKMPVKDVQNYVDSLFNHPSLVGLGAGYDGDAFDNLCATENLKMMRKDFSQFQTFVGIRDNVKLMRDANITLFTLSTAAPDSDLKTLAQLQDAGIRMPVMVWLQPTDKSPVACDRAMSLLPKEELLGTIVGAITDQSELFDFSLIDAKTREPNDLYYFIAARWSDKPILRIAREPKIQGNKAMISLFSNLKKVELFVNGVSCGVALAPFGAWEVELPEGDVSLNARGEDEDGNTFLDNFVIEQ